MKRSHLRTAAIAVCLSCLAAGLVAVTAQASASGSQAALRTNGWPSQYAPGSLQPAGLALGSLISSLTDASRPTAVHAGLRAPGAAYPSSYDLRKLGKAPPIEDQGNFGTCWDFAALGALESSMLPGDAQVFSADNLALKTEGYGAGGGTMLDAGGYLARWAGPILASQDAYGDNYTPPGLTPAYHVQNIFFLPKRANQYDNGAIKAALTNYGAVDVAMYFHAETYPLWQELLDMVRSTWNPDHNAYYSNGSKYPGHQVDIVGWDDKYPRENFATKPPGDGAFIVRNSWGTSFGDQGYFYVSYYDTRLARITLSMVFEGAEPTDNFSAIYQYDLAPTGTPWGASSDKGWMANDFTAAKSDLLSAVSFWAMAPNSRYTIYAKTGSAKTLTAEGSGGFSLEGYHTVHLARPMQLVAGQRFRVAVKLTTPGVTSPIKLGPTLGPTGTKQSFVSSDGRTWTDVSKLKGDKAMSVCLKAFTRSAAPTPGSGDWAAVSTSSGCAINAWDVSVDTLALKKDGTLWAWGSNPRGNLGLGTVDLDAHPTPTQVGSASGWAAVSNSGVNTLAIKKDGTLWAWGDNRLGQLGLGLGLADLYAHPTPTQVGSASDWAAVSAGDFHAVALKKDGTLWAWGFNYYGELGLGDTHDRDAPTQVGSASNWAAVSANDYSTLALKKDGTLWSWGMNDYGQLGLGTADTNAHPTPTQVGSASDWAAVSPSGAWSTLALKKDGTLWAWGFNSKGQLGLGDTVDRLTPTEVGSTSGWAAVSAGFGHTLAIKKDGTLWSWGVNDFGQLGRGTADTNAHPTPTQVGSTSGWAAVSAGYGHALAIKKDGTLWAWGLNVDGELGLSDTAERDVPTEVGGGSP